MTRKAIPNNLFFFLVALFGAAFIITIMALITITFIGSTEAPLARLLDAHAGALLTGEVVAILLTGFIALAVDRRQTRLMLERNAPSPLGQFPHATRHDGPGQDTPTFPQDPARGEP